jgi:hypothetical protein
VNGRSALTEGVHRAVRENRRVRDGIGAVRPAPPGSGRVRERKRARERALTGGVCLSGRAGARARAGARPAGLIGPNWVFSIFLELLNAFTFYFL